MRASSLFAIHLLSRHCGRNGARPGRPRPHRGLGPIAAGLALLLAPASLRGETVDLEIDPAQSTLALGSPAQLTLQVGGTSASPMSSTFPLVAPSTGSGSTLPDGTLSDGTVTSLGGTLRAEIGGSLDAPTSIQIVGRRSTVDPGTSGSWLPGVPGDPSTAAPGDFSIEFDDPATGAQGSFALRDIVLSLGTGGDVLALASDGSGGFEFPAGCNTGEACARLRVEDAMVDGDSNQGPAFRVGVGRSAPIASPAGTLGTLEPLGDGRVRLTIPIDVAATLTQAEIGGGFPLTLELAGQGQIVAVPEPGRLAGGALALATLALLGGVRALGRRLRATVAGEWIARAARHGLGGGLVLAVALGLVGCKPLFGSGLVGGGLSGFSCVQQFLTVYKLIGGEPSVLRPETDLGCQPSVSFNGDSDGDGSFDDFAFEAYVSYEPLSELRHLVVGANIDVSDNNDPLQAQQSARFGFGYTKDTTGTAELAIKAAPIGLKTGSGETVTGSLGVDVGDGQGFQTVPVDGQFRYIDLPGSSGTVTLDVEATTVRNSLGSAYQGIAISYGYRWNLCESDYQCRGLGFQYCTALGCTNGGEGAPCEHDSECTGGRFCSASGACTSPS